MIPEGHINEEKARGSTPFNPLYTLIIIALIIIGSFITTLDTEDDEGENIMDRDDVRYRSTEEKTPKVKQGRLSFDVTIDGKNSSEKVRLWLPYPTSNEHQDIKNVVIDGNHDYSAILRDSGSGTVLL